MYFFLTTNNQQCAGSSNSDLEYFENYCQNLEEQINSALNEIQNLQKKKNLYISNNREDFDYLDTFLKRSAKLNALY